MQGFRRILSGFLIVIMIACILPMGPESFVNRANAAGLLGLKVAEDSMGKLLTESSVTLEWTNVGADFYRVEFNDHLGAPHSILLNGTQGATLRQNIGSLQKDFIYEFKVTADFTSLPDVIDSKRVLIGITFDVPKEPSDGRLEDSAENLPGGGREIGARPGLRFKWKIPMIWDGASVVPYTDEMDPIDYNISIGTDVGATNKTQLKVRYSNTGSGQYIATMFTGTEVRTIANKVEVDTIPGYIYFDCYGPDVNHLSVLSWGNPVTAYPDGSTNPGFHPKNIMDYPKDASQNPIPSNLQTVYYNPDIKPGTVYRMKLEPVFNGDTSSDYTEYLPTSVKDGFTYTPVRFQVSKDSANNLLMTIFKINQEDVQQSQLINFTYQGMFSTNPNFTSYTLSAQQSDEFTPGGVLIIYIENKSYNTTFYYRVRANSPISGQVLNSGTIDYMVSQDQDQAPLPEEVQVREVTYKEAAVTNTFYVDEDTSLGGTFDIKTSDIKLRWKMPFNYSALIGGSEEVYYHILLSNVQVPVTGREERVERIFGDDTKSGIYHYPDTSAVEGGYREIFKINLRECIPTPDGNYLEYTLDGSDLFKTIGGTAADPVNADGYPTYLLPNKVYYLKMYSQKEGITAISDTSIPVSFTTAIEPRTNIPSPMNFGVLRNGVSAPIELLNHKPVVLRWEKVVQSGIQNINYELYISDGRNIPHNPGDSNFYDANIDSTTATGTFIKIGSTKHLGGDVGFGGFTDTASSIVEATIRDFSPATDAFAAYGEGLRPNSTYYFLVRTTATVNGDPEEKTSDFSQILAVTTLRNPIVQPGEDTLKPLAPASFAVAADGAGNLAVDASSVTLNWTRLESNAKYTLIRTSQKIGEDASIPAIQANPENKYAEYLNFDDPITANNPDFTYNAQTGVYSFRVRDLYPNMVYYFSLRAEKETSGQIRIEPSPWITIPVTTTLIEAPQLLAIVSGNEVGVTFTESNIFTPDDVLVSVNGTRVPRGQVFVSEQPISGGNSNYYVRVVALNPRTAYNINVKGSTVDGGGIVRSFSYDFLANQVDPALNTARTTTRDPMHEIDIKWKGKEGYKFELAIKGENDADYTLLQEGIGFLYMSKEKPANMVTTDYSMFYTRIPNLKSNTRYYVKVRSMSNNLITGESDYSIYVGPETTRTEFSQQDYNEDEQDGREINSYWDQVKNLKENFYWVLEDAAGSYRIKLKSDRAANMINSGAGGNFTVALSPSNSAAFTKGAVYIPISIWELLLSQNKSIVVKTPAGEYTIRPDTVNIREAQEIKQTKADTEIKEIYLYIEIARIDPRGYTLPAGTKPASDMFDFGIQVVGVRNNTDAATESRIIEILDAYINTGLIRLQNTPQYQKNTSQGLYDVIDAIVDSMMLDFQNDIRNMLENQWYGIRKSARSISSFSTPAAASIPFNPSDRDLKSGYRYVNNSWQAMPTTVGTSSAYFSLSGSGRFMVLSAATSNLFSVPAGHWSEKDIGEFNSRFNIRDVLDLESGTSVDDSINISKAVMLISKILSNSGKDTSAGTAAEKAKAMGLEGAINFSSPQRMLTREEAASLIMKVYQLKTGTDINTLRPVKNTSVRDSSEIGAKLYKAVEMSVDMNFLTLDGRNNFKPEDECTWAQIISGLTRLLKTLGEI